MYNLSQDCMVIVPEEHKVHWFLADVIVLIEVVLHYQSQFVYIHHLCVGF